MCIFYLQSSKAYEETSKKGEIDCNTIIIGELNTSTKDQSL
jgi:hypothetical protein